MQKGVGRVKVIKRREMTMSSVAFQEFVTSACLPTGRHQLKYLIILQKMNQSGILRIKQMTAVDILIR